MTLKFDEYYPWELPELFTFEKDIECECNSFLSIDYLRSYSLCDVKDKIKQLYNPARLKCVVDGLGFKIKDCRLNDFRLSFNLTKNDNVDLGLLELIKLDGKSDSTLHKSEENKSKQNQGAQGVGIKKPIPECKSGIELGSRFSSQHYKHLKTADIKDADIIVDQKTCKIPIDDSSVDLVVCEHTFEHLEDDHIEKLISEVNRILGKNGKFVVECPNTRQLQKAIYHMFVILSDREKKYDALFYMKKTHKESKHYKRSSPNGLGEGAFDLVDHLSKIYSGFQPPGSDYMPHINLLYPEKIQRMIEKYDFRLESSLEARGSNRFFIDNDTYDVDLRLVFEKNT